MTLLARITCLFTVISFSASIAYAGAITGDTLVLKNGDLIVGTIKGLSHGVIAIETDYSDVDLAVKWDGVRKISTTSTFVFTLESGDRVISTIRTENDSMVAFAPDGESGRSVNVAQIVTARTVKRDFLSRFNVNIDVGLSLTKARDQRQATVNSRAGYLADLWSTDVYYDDLFSSQDSTETIRRTNYGAAFRYLLPADFFVSADAKFLSNTEQAIDLRSSFMPGGGFFMIHTNRAEWSVGVGISTTLESFSNSTPDRSSIEGFLGTVLNLYNFGDLTFYTSAFAFPSFTESGRWRADVKMDVKYDLPLDLYIRAGVTANYDNQPAVSGNELDYVFTTGLGWEW